MRLAHRHRCGAEAVRGEHARHGAAGGQAHDQHVLAVRFADIGFGPTQLDAGHGAQLGGFDRGEIDGHVGSPARGKGCSSRPGDVGTTARRGGG